MIGSGKVARSNAHTGSGFDDFLKEEGMFEEVQAKALKRALAEQLEDSMQAAKLSKLQMARSRSRSRERLCSARWAICISWRCGDSRSQTTPRQNVVSHAETLRLQTVAAICGIAGCGEFASIGPDAFWGVDHARRRQRRLSADLRQHPSYRRDELQAAWARACASRRLRSRPFPWKGPQFQFGIRYAVGALRRTHYPWRLPMGIA